MSMLTRTRCSVFDRIVCGVDGSEPSIEAARQAGILRSGIGRIELVGVFDAPTAETSPYGAPMVVAEAEKTWATKLAAAGSVCPRAGSELLHGSAVERLLEHLAEADATLVAVGGTSRHRAIGLVRGSVTTAMLHRAPASVLVARPSVAAGAFPGSVVVGYDGSAGAHAALNAGRDVAERFGASLRVLAAGDCATVESSALAGLVVERDEDDPVDALGEVSTETDLLVVGSRGLHGLRALGSVSKRLGHQAACSVLVVR
jgi:nucleotide-binding universal stress UspA family protein